MKTIDRNHRLNPRRTKQHTAWPWLALLAALLLAGCGGTPTSSPVVDLGALEAVHLAPGQKLRVVATTNIVGDIVGRVGGDQIDQITLMRIGVDPHSYVPAPSDIAAIHDADVVFLNGAGLEANIDSISASAGGKAVQVSVSQGLDLLAAPAGAHAGEEAGHGNQGTDADPHVWFSVPNTIHWVDNIRRTLSALDPDHAAVYQKNADDYVQELQELDDWIQAQVATIPPEHRKLVTNHPVFAYLAARYGFEQVGTA